MPFKSQKQRKWMHANEPEMAAEWEAEEKHRKALGKRKLAGKGKKKKRK